MITNNNISTLTLAAGDTFYNNDLEKKLNNSLKNLYS